MAELAGNNFFTQEQEFLSLVSDDYVALAEMISIVMGTNRYHPTEKDYLNALEFIKYLMNKYQGKLKCLEGPEFQEVNMTNEEFIGWLKEMWYQGKYYRDIDYGVWFDLDLEELAIISPRRT